MNTVSTWSRTARLGGYRSNEYALIIQAAIEGQGLAIGRVHLIHDLIHQGRLSEVGTHRIRTDHPFTILTRTASSRPAVSALIEWLIANAPDSAW